MNDVPPDEARSWLRQELVRPEYQERDLLGRLLRWFDRSLSRLIEGAGAVPQVWAVVSILVAVLLAAALLWLVSRARGLRATASEEETLLGEQVVPAAELRRQAREAFEAGRYEEVVVQGFRAVVLGQVEAGTLAPAPGATAAEVAAALGTVHPPLHDRARQASRWFDEVRYGDRPAGRERAEAVLALDGELAGVR